ncbi:MAG: iron chelate uptake ABC transporter family permease subunit, partial [Candidatus Methanomethylophilaceae archaeon]|nr:iron chelate uptake ABC transporter family permease subunit [Candidatus Methanomethylophilaceae archaeon]
GLMAPHICRMIIGNDQRFLVPVSGVLGALILLVSDTVSRTILAPIEIPGGVIKYLLGVVFFIYIITRRNGRVLE